MGSEKQTQSKPVLLVQRLRQVEITIPQCLDRIGVCFLFLGYLGFSNLQPMPRATTRRPLRADIISPYLSRR